VVYFNASPCGQAVAPPAAVRSQSDATVGFVEGIDAVMDGYIDDVSGTLKSNITSVILHRQF